MKCGKAGSSVRLGGAKHILGCSCNEVKRGDMCLETLQGNRDKAKVVSFHVRR